MVERLSIYAAISYLLAHLAGVRDLDGLAGLSGATSIGLDLLDHIQTFADFAKDDVLPVQPRSLHGAEKELRAVGVGPGVGHAQNTRPGVLQLKVLVFELVSVDRLTTCTVVVGEVAALTHEVRDHTVEAAAFIAKTGLSGTEGTKVLGCFGNYVGAESHFDPAQGLVVGSDVKKYYWITHKAEAFP